MKRKIIKILSLLLCLLLVFQQTGLAQAAPGLDIAGHISALRQALTADRFRPLHLRYLAYEPQDNTFDLLLDKGGLKSPKPKDLEKTTGKLLEYFFVGISLPNDSFWVNLRPDSPEKIIDPLLAETDVGKILLEADLQLKKDTAAATSPDTPEGGRYWDKLYKKAEEVYGTSNVTIPTLTRPWIVPDEIIIRESQGNAYVYKATLKVLLEEDYLKESAAYNFKDRRQQELNEYSSRLIYEFIIPKLTKEINTSKKYAALRQVYYSLILAQWFKQRLSGQDGLYALLIDKKNLAGLTSKAAWSKATYFEAYQRSFRGGEYNYQVPIHTPFGKVIRSYFSGGLDMNIAPALAAAGTGRVQLPGSIATGTRGPTTISIIGGSGSPQNDKMLPARVQNSDPKPERPYSGVKITAGPAPLAAKELIKRVTGASREELVELAESLGLDVRPVKSGLLHPAYVGYDMAVKKIVNPDNAPLTVLYAGAGFDVSGLLLSTDATKAYFVDGYDGALNIERPREDGGLDSNDSEEDVDPKDYKFMAGFSYTGRWSSIDKFLIELESIGVDKKQVDEIARDFQKILTGGSNTKRLVYLMHGTDDPWRGGYYKVKFDWAYPQGAKKEREIVFISADIKDPETYPPMLNKAINEGLDAYFQKAGTSISFAYKDFLGIIGAAIKPGGHTMTDDYHHVIFDHGNVRKKLLGQIGFEEAAESSDMLVWGKVIRTLDRGYYTQSGYGWEVKIYRKKESISAGRILSKLRAIVEKEGKANPDEYQGQLLQLARAIDRAQLGSEGKLAPQLDYEQIKGLDIPGIIQGGLLQGGFTLDSLARIGLGGTGPPEKESAAGAVYNFQIYPHRAVQEKRYSVEGDLDGVIGLLKDRNWYFRDKPESEIRSLLEEGLGNFKPGLINKIKVQAISELKKKGHVLDSGDIEAIVASGSYWYRDGEGGLPSDLDFAVVVKKRGLNMHITNIPIDGSDWFKVEKYSEIKRLELRIISRHNFLDRQALTTANIRNKQILDEVILWGHGILMEGRDYFDNQPSAYNLLRAINHLFQEAMRVYDFINLGLDKFEAGITKEYLVPKSIRRWKEIMLMFRVAFSEYRMPGRDNSELFIAGINDSFQKVISGSGSIPSIRMRLLWEELRDFIKKELSASGRVTSVGEEPLRLAQNIIKCLNGQLITTKGGVVYRLVSKPGRTKDEITFFLKRERDNITSDKDVLLLSLLPDSVWIDIDLSLIYFGDEKKVSLVGAGLGSQIYRLLGKALPEGTVLRGAIVNEETGIQLLRDYEAVKTETGEEQVVKKEGRLRVVDKNNPGKDEISIEDVLGETPIGHLRTQGGFGAFKILDEDEESEGVQALKQLLIDAQESDKRAVDVFIMTSIKLPEAGNSDGVNPRPERPGGIDLSAMPFVIEAEACEPAQIPPVGLDAELPRIEKMIEAGIIPSGQRIKEYLKGCCRMQGLAIEAGRVIAAIADIMRLEEERALSTEIGLKELLALLESGKTADEFKISLSRISFEAKEPAGIVSP